MKVRKARGMSEKTVSTCTICSKLHEVTNLIELNGNPICFPCSMYVQWEDVDEVRRPSDYDDAVEQQREDKVISLMLEFAGLQETASGVIYYPDEVHENVYHLVGTNRED